MLVALLAAFTLAALAAEIPSDKEVVRLEAKNGTVTFPHKIHADREDVQCTTCHHTYQGEGSPQPCTGCHTKDSTDVPKTMKAFHDSCKGCHEEKAQAGEKSGPVKPCAGCHVKG
jgi:hypothetical protein